MVVRDGHPHEHQILIADRVLVMMSRLFHRLDRLVPAYPVEDAHAFHVFDIETKVLYLEGA